MKHVLTAGFALFMLAGASGTVLAQSAQEMADEVQAMKGEWEISNADRDKICIVTLAPDAAPGGAGMKLQFASGCVEAFALFKDVKAWKFDKDGLHLVDAKGGALLDLDEVERGMFEGMRAGEGRYFVQSLAAVQVEAKPEQLVGDWQVSRGTEEAICTITFSKTQSGGGFSLALKPDCGALITDFAPTSWNVDHGELVIASAKGVTWRFEEAGEIAWRRVPEGTDPLWLVRQTEIVPEGGG